MAVAMAAAPAQAQAQATAIVEDTRPTRRTDGKVTAEQGDASAARNACMLYTVWWEKAEDLKTSS